MTVLWCGRDPAGVCVFGPPAASLSARTRYFGLTDPRNRTALAALNEKVWLLRRVVLHPTYRGAGVASAFIRRASELCPAEWVETLSALGHANPVFERAGFARAGLARGVGRASGRHEGYAGRVRAAASSLEAGRFADPVYYVFDNRRRAGG